MRDKQAAIDGRCCGVIVPPRFTGFDEPTPPRYGVLEHDPQFGYRAERASTARRNASRSKMSTAGSVLTMYERHADAHCLEHGWHRRGRHAAPNWSWRPPDRAWPK